MRLNGRTERAFYIQETSMSEFIRNDLGGYYDTIVIPDQGDGYTYVAEAPIGTLRTDPRWRVKRIKDTGTEIQIAWADNHPGFVHTATDITSLTFRDI